MQVPVSFTESAVTGAPDRHQHGRLQVRKGVTALVYLEGLVGLEVPERRGKGI